MLEPSWDVVILSKQDSPEDVAQVVDEAIWGAIKSCGNFGSLVDNLKDNGACCIGPFYNDIAESLKFRMMQIANRLSLYNMSVRTVKRESEIQGRINNANNYK